MAKVAVRRVNEWDGPAMLKIYAPYTGTCAAPEAALPRCRSTCSASTGTPTAWGGCCARSTASPRGSATCGMDPFDPEDPWSVEFQVYVKEGSTARAWAKPCGP